MSSSGDRFHSTPTRANDKYSFANGRLWLACHLMLHFLHRHSSTRVGLPSFREGNIRQATLPRLHRHNHLPQSRVKRKGWSWSWNMPLSVIHNVLSFRGASKYVSPMCQMNSSPHNNGDCFSHRRCHLALDLIYTPPTHRTA